MAYTPVVEGDNATPAFMNARFAELQGAEVFNVKAPAYGATGDGTTNDTAAIQAAIDAAELVAGTVFFPVGTYSVGALTLNSDGVNLVGASWGSIIKLRASTNNHLITVDNASRCGVHNLKLDGNKANNTAGSCVLVLSNTAVRKHLTVEHCWIVDAKESGVRIVGSGVYDGSPTTEFRFANIVRNKIEGSVAHAIFLNWNAPYAVISQNFIDGTSATDANGIWVGNQSNYACISNNLIHTPGDMGIEYWVNAVGGGVVSGNVIKDALTCGISIGDSPFTAVIGNTINGVTLANAIAGIEIGGSVDVDGSTVIGNTVRNSTTFGIVLNGGNRVVIQGNVIAACGTRQFDAAIRIYTDAATVNNNESSVIGNNIRIPNVADVYGIAAWANAAGKSATNNVIAENTIMGQNASGSVGIHTECHATATQTMSIHNNRIAGVSTPIVLNANTVAVVRNNSGYVTEANGTATVANGTTTIAVTHGLSKTPDLQDISVTPTNNLGSAAEFWISTPTSTQFTINVNADPGASTATFVWTASIQ